MKKILAIALVVFLVLTVAGCASERVKQTEESEEATGEAGEPVIAGGWTLCENQAAALPEDVQKAFDKAMEEYAGMSFVPVGYLGSQVVAGMNYALLCEAVTVTAEPVTSLKVVIIYADLNGSAEITGVADFNLADYTQGKGKTDTETLMGGWSAPEEATHTDIPADAKEALDKAMEGFVGNDLDPMALLATQVVAGTNYAFLCRSTPVTAEPVSSVQIVTVYEDLEGNAEISNICTLDIADFTE